MVLAVQGTASVNARSDVEAWLKRSGIRETQEMLDYSVEHKIYPEVEVIQADGKEIDKAYQNVLDGEVKFRYVIDMSTMK